MAEAKDAELSMALEGNASLREQLADARAAAAQVHFLRGAVVLEFERSEIGDTARMCNVKGSWSLTVLSQLGKRPGSCSADGMIAGETACDAEQLVQTLHVLAVRFLQVPYLSCRLICIRAITGTWGWRGERRRGGGRACRFRDTGRCAAMAAGCSRHDQQLLSQPGHDDSALSQPACETSIWPHLPHYLIRCRNTSDSVSIAARCCRSCSSTPPRCPSLSREKLFAEPQAEVEGCSWQRGTCDAPIRGLAHYQGSNDGPNWQLESDSQLRQSRLP